MVFAHPCAMVNERARQLETRPCAVTVTEHDQQEVMRLAARLEYHQGTGTSAK